MHFTQGAVIGDEMIKMESGRRSWHRAVYLPYLFSARRVVFSESTFRTWVHDELDSILFLNGRCPYVLTDHIFYST